MYISELMMQVLFYGVFLSQVVLVSNYLPKVIIRRARHVDRARYRMALLLLRLQEEEARLFKHLARHVVAAARRGRQRQQRELRR